MKRAMRARNVYKKLTLLTAAFVLAVSSLTASVPFILSQKASAAPGYVYQGLAASEPQAYSSLGYQATSTNEFGDLVELASGNRLLNDVTVSFTSWACETGAWNTNDCISADGATFTHPVTVKLYAVGAGGAVGSVLAETTQTISAKYRPSSDTTMCTGADAGKWYSTADAKCYNGLAFNQTFNFSAQNKVLPNQVIVGISYNTSTKGYAPLGVSGPYDSLNVSLPTNAPVVGTDVNTDVMYWNTSWGGNGSASGVNNFGADTAWTPYHLGVNISANPVPSTIPCTTVTPVWFNSLADWNTSDTRSQGSNTITGDGINVKTWNDDDGPGSPDQRKAAAYLAVNYPLTNVGTQTIAESMDYQVVSGVQPGLQLVVDLDGNGTPDGILVGESVYGNDWWLASSTAPFYANAPVIGGGFGGPSHGTLNQWLEKYPTAQVKAIGYSLGSGVVAEGVIKSISLGCNVYKFDNVAPALPVHESPANNTVQSNNDFWFNWSDAAGAARYEMQNSTNPATDPATGSFTNVMWTGDYQGIQPTVSEARSVGASGTWYWQVRAIDAAGNASAWTTPWAITLDNVAPAAPTLVTPDWYIANGATKNLKWNAPADSDVVKYEYAEYNSVAPTSDSTTPSWTKTINAPATETTDTAWGSDVKIFWRVRAIDAAGNVSPWSETRTIITDRTNPTATINSATISADKKLNVSVTGTDNLSGVKRIEFNLYDAANSTKVASLQGVNYTAHNLSETSVLSPSFDISSLASGTYVVRAAVLDDAGNLSNYATQSITVDNTRPTATLSFPAIGPGATTFEVQYSEAVNPTEASDPANYFLENWVGAGGSGDLSGDASVVYNPVTYRAVVTFTQPGWYVSPEQKWGVQNVHDLVGNLLNTNPTVAYSTANVAPTTPGTPTTPSPVANRTNTWTWAASVDPGASNASGLKGYEYTLVTTGGTPLSWVFTTDTTVTTTAPADGSFDLVVRALDNAGNQSTEARGTVVIDTTGPNVTIDPIEESSTATPTITGTVGNDADFLYLSIDGDTPFLVPFSGGVWAYNFTTPLAEGDYTIDAIAVDSLNNTSVASSILTVAFPTTTPGTGTGNGTGSGGDDEEGTPVPPTPVTTLATTTPTIINPAALQQVLGDSTTNPEDTDDEGTPEVEGVSTQNNVAQAVDSDENQGRFLGLAWYWWILILAGIALLGWWIAAAIRRRSAEN